MQRLSGNVALVTGAAAGPKAALGSVFALALAAEGATVVVADKADSSSVVEEILASGGHARGITVDVAVAESVQAMMSEVDAEFGRLDILVNNAAVGSNIPPVPLEDLTVAAWDEVMAVNVRGPFLCAQGALPLMRRRGYGKIINIGSATILEGLPNRLHYLASKGATLSMTRALARELGSSGIRVNTLAPGLVVNPGVVEAMAKRPGALEGVRNAQAIKHDVHADALVGSLVYLASTDSDAVTGQFIVVDNGHSMS